jgi:mannose-6-phosphate isomerase-like protein (cupin superfamily)
MVTQSVMSLAPYNASLEYRPVPGVSPAAIHPTDAEFFSIVSGSATIVTGGTIVDGKIEGGTSQNVAKGDFVIVPENTNHWFTNVSENFFDLSLHVPRPVPPAGAAPAN